MPSTREYRRIFRRLFVTHLGLALLPLVALGIFSIDRINSIYDEKISAGIEAVCSSKHRALDTFLHERVSQIKTLAFTHDLAELRDPDRLSRIFTVMQQSGRSFVDLGIIGMDGRHISYVGPFDLRDANYVNAPWFSEVLRKGVFVSDVFMGFRNVPHFIIAVLRHEGHFESRPPFREQCLAPCSFPGFGASLDKPSDRRQLPAGSLKQEGERILGKLQTSERLMPERAQPRIRETARAEHRISPAHQNAARPRPRHPAHPQSLRRAVPKRSLRKRQNRARSRRNSDRRNAPINGKAQ